MIAGGRRFLKRFAVSQFGSDSVPRHADEAGETLRQRFAFGTEQCRRAGRRYHIKHHRCNLGAGARPHTALWPKSLLPSFPSGQPILAASERHFRGTDLVITEVEREKALRTIMLRQGSLHYDEG
jgi:hypothetical protein